MRTLSQSPTRAELLPCCTPSPIPTSRSVRHNNHPPRCRILGVLFQQRTLILLTRPRLTEEGPLTELFSQCHDKVRGCSPSTGGHRGNSSLPRLAKTDPFSIGNIPGTISKDSARTRSTLDDRQRARTGPSRDGPGGSNCRKSFFFRFFLSVINSCACTSKEEGDISTSPLRCAIWLPSRGGGTRKNRRRF